jgi:hypothetical protein
VDILVMSMVKDFIRTLLLWKQGIMKCGAFFMLADYCWDAIRDTTSIDYKKQAKRNQAAIE